MDGHITREGLTADLEAMKTAGIGGAIFLTVNVGVKKGPVEFMSPAWQELAAFAIKEADRLGIAMALGVGPGWSGAGGPWIKPDLAMQHLVASVTAIHGGRRFEGILPQPKPREPFFGRGPFTPALLADWKTYYRDVRVLAYPTPAKAFRIDDVAEKALYIRAPYSSAPGVRPYFAAPADPPAAPADACLVAEKLIDLTDKVSPDGRLQWDAPPGEWTVYRFGRTLTGQTTRPAPAAGLGFETDKFEAAALDAQIHSFLNPLLDKFGKASGPGRGLTMLHLDSWEMGSQNWSEHFRESFKQRRGYDPLPYLPALLGTVVTDASTSERFLWDLRQTARELVNDVHANGLRDLAHARGLTFSVEPYDMNPAGDLKLGSVADLPMCEFWSTGYGFQSEYSVIEATSVAHTNGRAVIGAEAFTAGGNEQWKQYPGVMKAQTDWALAAGVNKFVIHRYQHQPDVNAFPGMGMGPYGVHWERTQTWWAMVPAYHTYLTRCSALLRRGLQVADILYLAPEGAPHVFRPPASATTGTLPDRRGYGFDGCDVDTLIDQASVKDGRITFPDGMSYAVLVLPKYDTMTPRLLGKVKQLLDDGATVIGAAPRKSPSLSGYPASDAQVATLAKSIWGNGEAQRSVGRGRIVNDSVPVAAVEPADPLARAKWIWHDDGKKSVNAPPAPRYFRDTIALGDLSGLASAELVMTADNGFEAFVNGRSVGRGDDFRQNYTFDIAKTLKAGENVVTVTATNAAAEDNPAGLIGAITVRFSDGRSVATYTDARWTSSATADGPQAKVKVIGPVAKPPWNHAAVVTRFPDLYVDYDTTARVLHDAGVEPDFLADADLRYVHRRDGDADIYFIANAADHVVTATGNFRIRGKSPEWWNAVTGGRRALPEFKIAGGRTSLPLRFEPFESGFVVFRPTNTVAVPSGLTNSPMRSALSAVPGPWKVAFDPKWGGPAEVEFATLDDWAQRPEPGIRNYSGTAVYRTTFDAPNAATLPPGRQAVISLGDVKAMAAVKLNGQDLGVAWCSPWRVSVPAGLLRASGNELEIKVANLWINRLIGDAALSEKDRKTSTSLNPFKPGTPLQPSGLLGPVIIEAESFGLP